MYFIWQVEPFSFFFFFYTNNTEFYISHFLHCGSDVKIGFVLFYVPNLSFANFYQNKNQNFLLVKLFMGFELFCISTPKVFKLLLLTVIWWCSYDCYFLKYAEKPPFYYGAWVVLRSCTRGTRVVLSPSQKWPWGFPSLNMVMMGERQFCLIFNLSYKLIHPFNAAI